MLLRPPDLTYSSVATIGSAMVEYLNIRRGTEGSESGADVISTVEISFNAMLRWLESNQTLVFAIVVGLVVGFTLWQVSKGRRKRY